MPQKHTPKSEAGKQSASREQQSTRTTKSSLYLEDDNEIAGQKEQASKAADAGAAPEQLDSEPE